MKENKAHTTCVHCGDLCDKDLIIYNEKSFCCQGCQMVYQLLHENEMDQFYKFDERPGISQKQKTTISFEFLDDTDVISKLTQFKDEKWTIVNLKLPQIHCSSCLWLLENMHRLNPGIVEGKVDFLKKEARFKLQNEKVNLRQFVELLDKIGYTPELNFGNIANDNTLSKSLDRSLIYKIGVAGFAFGNIMLLSFPEYLGFEHATKNMFFGYINLILAIPVLLYAGNEYLKSAWRALRVNGSSIDIPIAIGMVTLFARSSYEVLSGTGEGYFDSFAGFIFFLLIGKWFQSFTYKSLDFERTYQSYFPISTAVKSAAGWITKTLDKINPGDIIRIRNNDLLPVDGKLVSDFAHIDYSFVTGESDLIKVQKDGDLFAGGKHKGKAVEVMVRKKVNQSYLTQLWNNSIFEAPKSSNTERILDNVSKYFTLVIIAIAIVAMLFWLNHDASRAFNVFTAVLIVACPCALALAIPFCFGNMVRLLSLDGFFVKNTQVIEKIQDTNYVIFDKTGTLTDNTNIEIHFEKDKFSDIQLSYIRSAVAQSAHPISQAIEAALSSYPIVNVDTFEEVTGKGIVAHVSGHKIKLGSADFLNLDINNRQVVCVEYDQQFIGTFQQKQKLRKGIKAIMDHMKDKWDLAILSGDSDRDADYLSQALDLDINMRFDQSPQDKLDAVKSLQNKGYHVMMIGDGLNDAGALRQSDVGIAVSDAKNHFSPACDAILSAQSLGKFVAILRYIKLGRKLLYGAFLFAFLYNFIGLYFAVTGQLSPVIAAILMPLSSISIIFYGVGTSYIFHHLVIKD